MGWIGAGMGSGLGWGWDRFGSEEIGVDESRVDGGIG